MRVVDAFRPVVEEIRTLTLRQAMGLPESYVEPEVEDILEPVAQLWGRSASSLVEVAEDPSSSTSMRLAAGRLLGMLGDPRIDVTNPPMVDIPAGRIGIGLAWDDVDAVVERYASAGVKRAWIQKECPRHTVDFAAFRIGRYPVTNAEYLVFLKDTDWPELPTAWDYGRFDPAHTNVPVHTVTPAAADAYAAWLSEKTGRAFRLPTEHEWEYAAAGPEGRPFPWGEYAPDHANTLESGLLTAAPIGCFPAGVSCFGAMDMSGNVEELTSSLYRPYPSGSPVDDDLAEQGQYRICRGGAFTRFQDLARCQRRHGTVSGALYPVSLRLAEEV